MGANKNVVLWGLVGPSGVLRGVFYTKTDAQFNSFAYQNDEFRTKYWKKYPASWRAAQRLGWKVVKGKFIEV